MTVVPRVEAVSAVAAAAAVVVVVCLWPDLGEKTIRKISED
jgi:hypothetical protein